MATPYSQLIGIQALMNVAGGERYAVIPEENLMYLAGWYGTPPAPIDPGVLERAFSTQRGREIQASSFEQPTLKEIRAQYGERLSDEELLLRYLFNPAFIDAMYAGRRPIEPIVAPTDLALVDRLMGSRRARSIHVTTGGVSVSLRRRREEASTAHE
ncbi:MAG TPA: hypothetical protein VHX88_18880 [Solirubrobacteraceae bacterium]|jgi:oxaloacetate decarboxylase alpha subunit|nr:hypothetical protein [Solirubrobacteraceae bacterium]